MGYLMLYIVIWNVYHNQEHVVVDNTHGQGQVKIADSKNK